MAREFSVVVGINAARAQTGARQFKAASNTVVRGTNRMTAGMKRTNRSGLALITTIGRIRGVATLAFAGFLGVGGLGAVVKTLSQFETSISQVTALISAQNPNSLGGAMNALTTRARELGATTLFTATQAAEGMKFLTLAGFDALEVYQAIGPALNLAAAGMLGLGEAADIVSNIMAAFNVDASRTEEVADSLAFTAARTNTNIRQLGEAMKFVGPVAGTLGVDVQETAVALGILGNSGLQASLAGTSLRRVMSGLLNPSKEAQKVFSTLNVTQEELVALMQGDKGLVRLVQKLADSGIDAADAFTLFGQRGAPGLLSLVTQVDKLAELTDELDGISGTAERMAKILADNLGGDARIALSALQEAILRLGDSGLTDWLRSAVQGFTGFIRAISGVPTPLEDLNAAMLKGINIGTSLKENFGLIKAAATGLVLFLSRNLIRALAVTAFNMGVAATNALGLGFAFTSTQRGAMAAAAGIHAFRAAIISTGIGIAFVAAGALVNWLMSMDSAAESTRSFNEVMEETRLEGEELAITFHTLNQRQQEYELGLQQSRINETKDKITELTDALQAQNLAVLTLADDQADYNKALEESNSIDTGNLGTSNLMAATEATSNLNIARMQLNETEKAASLDRDTALRQLANLEDALQEQEQLRRDLIAVQSGEAESVQALRDARNREAEQLREANALHKEAFGLSIETTEAIQEILKKYLKQIDTIADLREAMDTLNQASKGNQQALDKLGITSDRVTKAKKELAFAIKTAEQALSPLQKETLKYERMLEDLRDGTDKVAKINREYTRTVFDLAQAYIRGSISLDEYTEAVALLKEQLTESQEELENTCNKTKNLKKCMSEEAKAMEAIWDQANRNIQDAFADAFKGAFDSFDEFGDRLLGAFKDMVAEILSAKVLGALRKGLENVFSGDAGSGNFFSRIGQLFQQGEGGGGGFFSNLGSLFGGGGAASSGGSGAGFFGNLFGGGSSAGAASGASSGAGGLGGAGGALFSNPITAIIAAAIIGNANLFSAGYRADTADINIGELIGTALTGTFGEAITGSTILAQAGALLADKLLQGLGLSDRVASILSGSSIATALFGRKAPKATATGFNFGFEEGEVIGNAFVDWFAKGGLFRSNKRGTEIEDLFATDESVIALQEGFDAILDPFAQIVAIMGGSVEDLLSFSTSLERIDLTDKSEEEISEILAEFLATSAREAVVDFLRTSDSISLALRTTVLQFEDSIEDMLTAFSLIANIETLRGLDVAAEGQRLYDEALRTSRTTLFHNMDALRLVIDAYDGSLESLAALENAYAVVTEGQVALVAQLMEADAAISGMFQGSAQTIREALLNEEELFNLRKSQIDELVEQARQTTDPEELTRLAQEINRLGLDAFNLLDEGQQGELGAGFIDFFEELDELFGGQIGAGLDQAVANQSALDQEVADTMTDAANAIIESNNAATDLWVRWREDIDIRANGGGGVNLRDTELSF